MTVKQYIVNNLRAWDIMLNALSGGKVRTISARIGNIIVDGKLHKFPIERFINSILEKFDKGHAVRSYHHWKDGK